jgi:hypothetical protein
LALLAQPAGMLVVALSIAIVVLIQISWAGLMVKLQGNGIKLRVVAIFFKYNIQGSFFWVKNSTLIFIWNIGGIF